MTGTKVIIQELTNSAQYFVKNEYSNNVTDFESDNYVFKYHMSIMPIKDLLMIYISSILLESR